jgi:small subunit ribosomal protein S15
MLKHATKKKIIGKHRTHDSDTGSPHVQVAILTAEIDLLVKHLQEHPKDESARRGLLGKVAQRRKILNYMRMHDTKTYEKMIESNKLKK